MRWTRFRGVGLAVLGLTVLGTTACSPAPPPAPVAAPQPDPDPDPEREAVLAAVQGLFDAMETRDVEAARRVLIEEGHLFAVGQRDGRPARRSFTNAEFLEQLGASTGSFLERFWDPEVRIHDGIATVWAPYDFWLDGEFSHCGIDAFDLVRTEDGWKIAGGVYTSRSEGCEPSPLGPPSG